MSHALPSFETPQVGPPRTLVTFRHRHTCRLLAIPVIMMSLIVGLGAALDLLSDRVTWETMLRDPAATFHASPFTGLLSHLGVMAMITCGAVCLFAATLVRSEHGFLIWAGVFALIFGLDDLTMAHEDLLPSYLGIPEIFIFAFYGVAAVALIASQFEARIKGPVILLALAPVFLGVSVILDQLPGLPLGVEAEIILEDLAKLCGIGLWAMYWIATSHALISKRAFS